MVTENETSMIKNILSDFETIEDVDVSGREDPYCVISFMTTFDDGSAYDLELTASDSGFEVVLLTSSEIPLMRDEVGSIDEDQIDSLLDHVIETIRELEGN